MILRPPPLRPTSRHTLSRAPPRRRNHTTPRTIEVRDPTHPVARAYLFHQHQKSHTSHLGSTPAPHYRPHTLIAHPPPPSAITLELLLASQTHLGHATQLWHPANAPHIFGTRGAAGTRDAIHIISPDATAAHLRRASAIVRAVAARAGLILFVGTRPGHARIVVDAARRAGACHLFTRWIAGSLTNAQRILGRCARHVVDGRDRRVWGFADQLRTAPALVPDLVVVLNPGENGTLLAECAAAGVPTIGVVDTDVDPLRVTYVIPANDDSLRAVALIAGVLGRAGAEGREERMARARVGQFGAPVAHGLVPPTPGQAERERAEEELQRREGEAEVRGLEAGDLVGEGGEGVWEVEEAGREDDGPGSGGM